MRSKHFRLRFLLLGAGVLLVLELMATAQPSTKTGEWTYWGGDSKGAKYSPLSQIDATNFNKLEVAWRLKTDLFGPRPEYKLEGTPLMINGVLYTTAGTRRDVWLSMPKPEKSCGPSACPKAGGRQSLPGPFPATASPGGPMDMVTTASSS